MKRKIFSILFALVLVLSFSLMTAVPVAAAEIPVDSGMSTAVINGKIAAATDGDVIVFAEGTYILTEPLVVDVPGVTLQGANAGVPGTGARGDESTIDATSSVGGAYEGGAVAITADGVKVDGFTITGARWHAIWVFESQGCTITNNILSDNGWRGVLLKGGSHGNTITNNAISDNGREGIYLYEDVGGNTIANNVISHSGRPGIYVSWSDDNTIENNVISDSGEVDSSVWGSSGISLNGAFRNTLTGNTLSNQCSGISMRDSVDNTLTHNTISNNDYGIYLRVGAVTGNVDNEVHYNNIVGNTEYGVYNAETGTFDATNNWWGAADGPSHSPGSGDKVSDNVNYIPWLTGPWIGGMGVGMATNLPDIVAITVAPNFIDFGTLYPGSTSASKGITVGNIGTRTVDVDVGVGGTALFTTYLEMRDSTAWSRSGGNNTWTSILSNLAMGASDSVWTRLPVPLTYTPKGVEEGSLTFTAKAK